MAEAPKSKLPRWVEDMLPEVLHNHPSLTREEAIELVLAFG